MPASSTQNVKLGICTVIFDGIDLGYTKGGVEVEVSSSTHEVIVDQFGETPINDFLIGRKASAKVPLAEATLDNMLSIMPGAQLIANGSFASATATFLNAIPAVGDRITVAGVQFTYVDVAQYVGRFGQVLWISGMSLQTAAQYFCDAVNLYPFPYSATVSGTVVTITAKRKGAEFNGAISRVFATPANLTLSASIAGGTDMTRGRVEIPTGVSLALMPFAKVLILRPKGTTGADDFTIHRACCPGELQIGYATDKERIFVANFKSYATDGFPVFAAGNSIAI